MIFQKESKRMTMTEYDLSSFGSLLKAFRKRRHLTQQQLAQAIGVHRSAIIRWEQGDFLPESKALVLELARHLHLDDQQTRQLLEASLTALSSCWHVPLPRNPNVTGREEILETLRTQLGVNQAVALTQSSALHGLGGVGKTQIALEYVYRHALNYSAVFWIGAETAESIVSGLLQIAEVLQLPGRDDQDQQHVIAAAQRWLTTHSQWLLIWDNVEDLSLLHRFLPSTRKGVILITMRRQALGTLAWGMDLLPMEREEGMRFLLRRAKVLEPEVTSEQMRQLVAQMSSQYTAAAELVTAMGGLPLALDQAAAYIEETQCGLSAYLELFHTQCVALLQRRGEESWNHPESVATTFTLAITIAAERHSAVRDLLQVCALLQPDAIPEELFVANAAYPGTALEPLTADPCKFNQIIAILLSLSLVQRQPEAQTLSLHRLVQAVLLEQMSKPEQALWQRRVIIALNNIFPEVTPEVWRQCERLLPHVLACVLSTSDSAGGQDLVNVLRKAADYLRVRAQYEQAELLYQRALDIGERVLGTGHPDQAVLLGGLAILYTEQDKHEQAESLYQRALQIREQAFGSKHPLVAHSLHGLAHLYYRQGKYEQAESLYQRALLIREQAFGSKHPLVADSYHGLAYLYSRQGKYEQAESLYQRALLIREQVLGPTHPDLAASLNGLAILYQEQGKYEQAEALFQRALNIWEQVLRPEHPQVAAPLYSLALIYCQQGRLEQAEPLYQRALHIWEQALGPAHSNVASPLNGLANLYLDQGKFEQSEQLCKRALHIWEQALGPAHPNVGHPLDTLATLYHEQGRFEQAELLYQRALHIWEQAFGSEHPSIATSLNKLANLFSQQGKYQQAEPLYQRALHIREQHLSQHHPETAETLHDLAIFQQKQGHLSEAISFAQRALSIRLQSLGEAHPQTVATRTLSAQLLQEQTDVGAQKDEPFERSAERASDRRRNERPAGRAPRPSHDRSSAENDPFQAFLDACCELHPLAWCRISELWHTYEQWIATSQRRIPLSRRAFAAPVNARGCRVDRTSTARIWRGITLVKMSP